jgi:hypothetical protein
VDLSTTLRLHVAFEIPDTTKQTRYDSTTNNPGGGLICQCRPTARGQVIAMHHLLPPGQLLDLCNCLVQPRAPPGAQAAAAAVGLHKHVQNGRWRQSARGQVCYECQFNGRLPPVHLLGSRDCFQHTEPKPSRYTSSSSNSSRGMPQTRSKCEQCRRTARGQVI